MTKNIIMLVVAASLLASCGGGKDTTKGALPKSSALRSQLERSTASSTADFPAVEGRTLNDLTDELTATGTQVGLATANLTTGVNRLGFGVIDGENSFVYGKTAVYLADSPSGVARGPFPAPADLLLTDPAFRSRQAATENDPFVALYETSVRLPRAGNTAMLVVSKLDNGRIVGAGATIRVRKPASDPVARVGSLAPKVTTDTRTSAAGNMKAIDTRLPTDDRHEVNFADVAGKKPVALLFATPQLCQSCGASDCRASRGCSSSTAAAGSPRASKAPSGSTP